MASQTIETPTADTSVLGESDASFINELKSLIRAGQPITLVTTENTTSTAELISSCRHILSSKIKNLYFHSPTTRWAQIPNSAVDFSKTVLEYNEKLRKAKTPDDRAKVMPKWLIESRQDGGPIIEVTRPTEELMADLAVGEKKDDGDLLFILSLESVRFKEDKVGVLQALRDFDDMVSRNLIRARLIILAHNSYTYHKDFYNLMVEINHASPSEHDLATLFDQQFIAKVVSVQGFRAKYVGKYDDVIADFTAPAFKTYCLNILAGLPFRLVNKTLRNAYMACIERENEEAITAFNTQTFKDFIYQVKFNEMNKIGTLELMNPSGYSQVGGFTPLKNWLTRSAWGMTEEARTLGVDTPKGCALVGPPGTGKSLIAQTAASIFGYPCLKFNVDAVFNKYVGESEHRLNDTLRAVEAMAPCVLFIDEVDKVFTGGGSGSLDGGVSSRIFGKLLSWMQDTKLPVFSIVTANRIQRVPAEFLRKGRLDEIWFINFPTSKEREEILNIHLARRGKTMTGIQAVLDITENYSGAELDYIVKEAVTESAFTKKNITVENLVEAANNIIPSYDQYREDIEYMTSWAETNARKASEGETDSSPILAGQSETIEA